VKVGEIPDVAALAKATTELLLQGPSQSECMRQQLALTYGIDPSGSSWRRFVNNHAWALVRLQAQGAIRKLAIGRYELVPGEDGEGLPKAHATLSIRDDAPLPKWAHRLVTVASWKNAKRWPQAPAFEEVYLRALWKECGGRCMLTGLPFKETQLGTGQARKPYALSLDRIDAEQPYTLKNCRLVLQAVNFALNVWGDEVFLEIAAAATQHSSHPTQAQSQLPRVVQVKC
jgi:hypothetical protein